jgi:GntR family transcriptional regulator
LDIHLSAGEGVPFYLQIVRQVKYLVASGRLATGQEVLPIRRLAERLQVNPNTVARAYRELERDGIVVKRRTAGTFVSEAGSPLAHDERIRILTDRVDALLAEADQMDVPIKALSELLTKRATIMSRAKQAAPKQHHNSSNKEG